MFMGCGTAALGKGQDSLRYSHPVGPQQWHSSLGVALEVMLEGQGKGIN